MTGPHRRFWHSLQEALTTLSFLDRGVLRGETERDDSGGKLAPSPLSLRQTIVSSAQPEKACERAYGALDNPTHANETAAVSFTAAGDLGTDTEPAHDVSRRIGGIRTARIQLAGPFSGFLCCSETSRNYDSESRVCIWSDSLTGWSVNGTVY